MLIAVTEHLRGRCSRALRALSSALCLEVSSCQSPKAGPAQDTQQVIQRGDRVLVELRAAEFFEAMVLAASPGQLRVAPINGEEPIRISPADVYRLPVARPLPFKGQYAVCHVGPSWVGCLVSEASANSVEARTALGSKHVLSREEILAPSALTELNVKQHFARTEERAAFLAAAASAGEPTSPREFRVLPQMKVVALRRGQWESGVVTELGKAGVYVTFSSDGLQERATAGGLMPEPSQARPAVRGEFALVRPESAADPWKRMRVVASNDAGVKVVDEDGRIRNVSERDLLPLAATHR